MEALSFLNRITINPLVCHGKPTIRNKRYTVESMLEYLSAGDSMEDLLAEFTDLEREDLLACLQYATKAVKIKSYQLAVA